MTAFPSHTSWLAANSPEPAEHAADLPAEGAPRMPTQAMLAAGCNILTAKRMAYALCDELAVDDLAMLVWVAMEQARS